MARRNTRSTRYEYIEGNTVRQMESVPIPVQKDRERRAAQARKEAIDRNRQRQLAIDAGFMLFLTIAVIATMVVCMNFIRLKSEVETATNEVYAVKKEIIELKDENDSEYDRVITSVNLDDIKRIATEEYGMVPAKKDQIITFKSDEEDYVTQYKVVSE